MTSASSRSDCEHQIAASNLRGSSIRDRPDQHNEHGQQSHEGIDRGLSHAGNQPPGKASVTDQRINASPQRRRSTNAQCSGGDRQCRTRGNFGFALLDSNHKPRTRGLHPDLFVPLRRRESWRSSVSRQFVLQRHDLSFGKSRVTLASRSIKILCSLFVDPTLSFADFDIEVVIEFADNRVNSVRRCRFVCPIKIQSIQDRLRRRCVKHEHRAPIEYPFSYCTKCQFVGLQFVQAFDLDRDHIETLVSTPVAWKVQLTDCLQFRPGDWIKRGVVRCRRHEALWQNTAKLRYRLSYRVVLSGNENPIRDTLCL